MCAVGRDDAYVDALVEHTLAPYLVKVGLERVESIACLTLVDATEVVTHKLLAEGSVGIFAVDRLRCRLQRRGNALGVLQQVQFFFQCLFFALFQSQFVHFCHQCFQLLPAVCLVLFLFCQMIQPLRRLL